LDCELSDIRRSLLPVTGNGELKTHVTVLDSHTISSILDGQRFFEIAFSTTSQIPHGSVGPGDIVLLKAESGPVLGVARASRVRFFPKLTRRRVDIIRQVYNDLIQGDRDFWKANRQAKCAALVQLSDVHRIEPTFLSDTQEKDWLVDQQTDASRLRPASE
jgi:hypothetical protein